MRAQTVEATTHVGHAGCKPDLGSGAKLNHLRMRSRIERSNPGSVRAGMRRARLEGRQTGRNPIEVDQAGIRRDRCQGQSLRQIAKGHRVSAATIWRVLHDQTAQLPEKPA